MLLPSRRRGGQPLRSLAFALPHPATLLLLRNCDLARDPLACRLDSILKILYGAAGVLLIVLLGVVWAAVHMYRRKRTIPPVVGDDE